MSTRRCFFLLTVFELVCVAFSAVLDLRIVMLLLSALVFLCCLVPSIDFAFAVRVWTSAIYDFLSQSGFYFCDRCFDISRKVLDIKLWGKLAHQVRIQHPKLFSLTYSGQKLIRFTIKSGGFADVVVSLCQLWISDTLSNVMGKYQRSSFPHLNQI